MKRVPKPPKQMSARHEVLNATNTLSFDWERKRPQRKTTDQLQLYPTISRGLGGYQRNSFLKMQITHK
jgi:hypothetical protein